MALNPEQRRAVAHRGSPLLVLAGAGTGKTRVITHRVAALLDEGIPAWRILAVTFTNRAAAEMRERIAALCENRHPIGELWIGTFHAICARILRRHGEALGYSRYFTIYDVDDQVSVMRRVLRDLGVPDRLYAPRQMLGYIDRAKNRGLGPTELAPLGLLPPVEEVVAKVYREYQLRLQAADAVDFGDLLVQTVRLLRAASESTGGQLDDVDPVRGLLHRFKHVVVDEFQDTNPIQSELVELLAGRAELCVVGDDDQAIYGWRGADVAQILRFPDRHPDAEVVRLEQNYRSTTHILDCADAVIRVNRGRLGKKLWSELGPGDPVRVVRFPTERDEARRIATEIAYAVAEGAEAEQFAIFYRTHAQSRVLEDELRRAGLGCRIVGGVAFYERAEIKDVLAYLVVIHNPQSDAHLLRILNRPARGIGKTSQDRLVAYATSEKISLWEALASPGAAGLARSAAGKVLGFRSLIEGLREGADHLSLTDLLERVLAATEYRESLLDAEDVEAQMRLENVQELQSNLQEFVETTPGATLPEYLELVSLAGGERSEGDQRAAVTLMTIHSAKGLEFGTVYVTGLEERVFPHARVLDDFAQLEEERRLAYVALTRAKRQLVLTMAERRRLFGQVQVGIPSQFLRGLPHEALLCEGTAFVRPQSSFLRAAQTPAPTPSWQDDIHYDEDFDARDPDEYGEETALRIGMTVRHRKFGDGALVGWSGDGHNLKLQLRFPEHGVKTIAARFCEF